MLMNDEIMLDRYHCINSTKNCENEENIEALYCMLTTSRFPMRVRYVHDSGRDQVLIIFARALPGAW